MSDRWADRGEGQFSVTPESRDDERSPWLRAVRDALSREGWRARYQRLARSRGGRGDVPVVAPGHDAETVTRSIASIVLRRGVSGGWLIGFLISFMFVNLLLLAITYLLVKGTGIWGINVPVAWGFAIINFVWWIGIGHAGTLISAILLLFRQNWRTSINRFAEAMTLFAVLCAGLFPLLHTGRPWLAFWMLPYPNTLGVQPQFRSPLIWDVSAVSTYLTVSFLFWYVGLIPDLATLRDYAHSRPLRRVFAIGALGWRGAARHWHRYDIAYLLLAGLSTPLVLSVHSIVSLDFAYSIIPGWHATIFPPYFVAGAIYAGFAMVLTLLIPIRAFYGLQDFITTRHLHNCAKTMLATGLIVFYGYLAEAFYGWYSGNLYERFMVANRMMGTYAPVFWLLIICNGLIPQVLWSSRLRGNLVVLFAVSMAVNVGMWLERFIIVVTSLHRGYLPARWGNFMPTAWDIFTYAGTIGLFLVLIFLFIRVLPIISMFEMRALVHETAPKSEAEAAAP